jgi:hypothetical protein
VDASSFYYTYSTISQTLATMYGLLLAAYVFGMQSADADQKSRSERYDEARSPEGWDLATMAKEALRGQRDVCGVQGLANNMRVATRWTIGTIAACLILMPVTVKGLLFSFCAASWISLIGTVGLALWCLVLYYRIIMRVIPKPN